MISRKYRTNKPKTVVRWASNRRTRSVTWQSVNSSLGEKTSVTVTFVTSVSCLRKPLKSIHVNDWTEYGFELPSPRVYGLTSVRT